jgi:Carbamoylphosphate synthase large subunit (split gene in MJ)
VILGSSSEYDHSAVSVCRALIEEGISIGSGHSTPGTTMTDRNVVDTDYIESLNGQVVQKFIAAEIPDVIIGTSGREAELNICLDL